MPSKAKPLENQKKHLTKAERAAREQAEAAVMPIRSGLELKPGYVKTDAEAAVMPIRSGLELKPPGYVKTDAEAAVMPIRSHLALKPPGYVKTDAKAKRYWLEIVRRMEGLSILDALDGEVLAVYCTMLSRRDAAHQLFAKLLKDSKAKDADPEAQAAILAKLDSLMTKLQGQERSILQYADKLGLTPSGRVHLARKRAEAAGDDPDADLFGS